MSDSSFPVENIPFGIISTLENSILRPATIIESTVIDLSVLEKGQAFYSILSYPSWGPLQQGSLNPFAALSKDIRSGVRRIIQELWTSGEIHTKFPTALYPVAAVTNHLPMETRNYADYVSSRGHFENIQNLVGVPQEKRNPFYHMPTGYYGNSRGIVVSGTPVHRFTGLTAGQFQREVPATLGPSKNFDFELELGIYISKPSEAGKPIPIAEADEHIFGFVLLNDWSARDIQSAESGGPTGPFLGKSGCVTISPWIVTLDALQNSIVPRSHTPIVAFVKHLSDPSDNTSCLDIRCSAFWSGQKAKEFPVSAAEYKGTYWTHRQLLAHQTCNGASVGTGDLLGTGTMSEFESKDEGRCCLIERSYNGTREIEIGEGEKRIWIEDGDEIVFRGWAYDAKTGEKRLGFGECRGVVVPL